MEVGKLAREVVRSGAEVTAPRKLVPFWRRKLEPEDVVEKLDEGKLRIRLPGHDPLPLKSAEDLEEAAVFQKLVPAQPGSLHEQVLQLETAGWQFADEQGRKLGPYGAYNALTDPAHDLHGLVARNHNGAVALDSQVRLGELHQFSQTPEARLEAEGWQFFSPTGEQHPALFGGQIGRDGQPWIEVGDPQTQRQRLERFGQRLANVGSVALVRRLEQHPGDLPRMLEGLRAEDRRALARQALSEMAPMQSARDAGSDRELQALWLEAAAPRHSGARVAFEAHKLDFAQEGAWQAALAGKDGLGVAADLMRGSETLKDGRQKALAQAILTGLTDHPAAAEAASWQSQHPAGLLSQILAKPDVAPAELALTLPDWDREAQSRYLAGLPDPIELARLHGQVKDSNAAGVVFRQACSGATDVPLVCHLMHEELRGRSLRGEDRARVGNWMLERLSSLPTHASACAAARSWGPNDPLGAAGLVLQDPQASEDTIARKSITDYDPEAQRRYMPRLKGPLSSELLELHRQLKDFNTYSVVFQQACREPKDVLQLCHDLHAELKLRSSRGEDRARVGNWMLERLSQLPSHASACAAARSWKPEDPFGAAALALEDPQASEDAIARKAITDYDPEAQRRYMPRLKGPMTSDLLELHGQLKDFNAYSLVFHAACKNPTDALALCQELHDELQTRSLRGQDRNLIGNWMLDHLSALPTHQAACQAARSWRGDDPFRAARLVLEDPQASEDAIARKAISDYDCELQRRYMPRLTGPMTSELLELHGQLKDFNAYSLVFQEACKNPGDGLKLCQALHGELRTRSLRGQDRAILGSWLLERLSAVPTHAAASAAARSWRPEDPFGAAGIALENPGASEDQIARKAISDSDPESQRRYMPRLSGPLTSDLLQLHGQLKDFNAYSSVYRFACQNPDRNAAAFEKLLEDANLRTSRGADRARLGNFVLDQMASLPDSRVAAEAVKGWGVSDPVAAASALCENPKLSTPSELDALALAAISSWDSEAQGRHLAQIASRPGAAPWMPRVVELHQSLKDFNSRAAVWQMAAQGSAGNLQAFADQLASLHLKWEDQRAVEGLMRDIQAELEARQLVAGLKDKSQAIAVEQDRVLVGGVVIRRKASEQSPETQESPLTGASS